MNDRPRQNPAYRLTHFINLPAIDFYQSPSKNSLHNILTLKFIVEIDMYASHTQYDIEMKHHQRHVSWGAILAGVVIALMTSALLNLLGLGIGLINFEADANVLENISIGTVIWLVVTGILAMFLGGWVAGRLAKTRIHTEGALHGLAMWGVSGLLGFALMATSAGMLFSGAAHIVNGGANLLGKNTVALSQGTVQNEFKAQVAETSEQDKAAADKASTALGTIAVVSFFVLLFGAIVSGVGGAVGSGAGRNEEEDIEVKTREIIR